MKSTTYLAGLLAITTIFSSGCVRRPDGVATDKKMASVIADMELGEAWLHTMSSTTSDDKREALKAYVIEKNGLTVEEYDSTMSWYLRNPDAYYELCDLAQKELMKRQRQLAGKVGMTVETTNLWPYGRQVMFSQLDETDGLIFSIPTSEVNPGEQVHFKMRFNNPSEGMVLIGVEYDDGASEFINRRLSGVERVNLTLYTDTSRSVTRMFGNLTLSKMGRKPLWGDSILLSVQPFDSTKFYNRHTQHFIQLPTRRHEVARTDSIQSDSYGGNN